MSQCTWPLIAYVRGKRANVLYNSLRFGCHVALGNNNKRMTELKQSLSAGCSSADQHVHINHVLIGRTLVLCWPVHKLQISAFDRKIKRTIYRNVYFSLTTWWGFGFLWCVHGHRGDSHTLKHFRPSNPSTFFKKNWGVFGCSLTKEFEFNPLSLSGFQKRLYWYFSQPLVMFKSFTFTFT